MTTKYISAASLKSIFILYIAFILGLGSLSCKAEKQLHISTGFTPPVSDFYNSVLMEVDKRMEGISIIFELLPAERSLVMVNRGINDGECCRFPAVVTRDYDNLIANDESFFSVRFSAFSKKDSKSIKSFNELKPYSVGSVEGWKLAVNKIKEIKPAEIHIVTTPEQMFNMIDQGRVNYGVIGYLSGLQIISKLKLNNIKAIEPPLIEKSLYLVLHKKHKALIPEFNRVIKSMLDDGTVDRLYDELIKSF